LSERTDTGGIARVSVVTGMKLPPKMKDTEKWEEPGFARPKRFLRR
jgi:hypothetical protein